MPCLKHWLFWGANLQMLADVAQQYKASALGFPAQPGSESNISLQCKAYATRQGMGNKAQENFLKKTYQRARKTLASGIQAQTNWQFPNHWKMSASFPERNSIFRCAALISRKVRISKMTCIGHVMMVWKRVKKNLLTFSKLSPYTCGLMLRRWG